MTITISKKWLVFVFFSMALVLGNLILGGIFELTFEEITKTCYLQLVAVLSFCMFDYLISNS